MSGILSFFQKSSRVGALGFALLGLLAAGVLATETRLLFYWPAIMLFGLSAVLLVGSGRWPLRSAPSDVCLATALLFGGYVVWSTFTSPVIIYAREDLFLLLGCVVVYTLSATVFSDSRLRMVILWLLVLITLGNLVVGFIHFSGKWTFHIVPSYMRTFGEGQRIGGFYNNANHLAAFLTMMTLLFAGMAVFGRQSVLAKLLLGFTALFSATGMALTVSRGAMLGMLAGVIVLVVVSIILIYRAYPHVFGMLMLGVGAVTVFGGLVIFGVFSEQLGARFGTGAFSRGDPRLYVWKSALLQHEQAPFTGVGSRMFYEGCITYRTDDSPSWLNDAQFVHNDWLQLLTEYGWLGILFISVLLLFHFREGWRFLGWFIRERFPRIAMLSGKNLGMVVGAISALVAVLVHAIFDFHLHVPSIALITALFLGILANPGITDANWKPVRVPAVRFILKYSLLLAGGWMIYSSVILGAADYDREIALKQETEADMGMARVAWLGRAVEKDPLNADIWYQRGLTRLESAGGQPAIIAKLMLERAVMDFERSWKLNPYNVFTALALADTYDALGRKDEALRMIKSAIPLAPISENPRLSLALHYHRNQMWEKADQAYLWAGDAKADKTREWYYLYMQMQSDAAVMSEQENN